MMKIKSKFSEADYVGGSADIIEKSLESFNLFVKVAEISIEKKYFEFHCEVKVGTDLREIEKHTKDLALALASPTDKVKLVIPIPGKSQIGIQVPKPPKEYYENTRKEAEKKLNAKDTWNEKIAFTLFLFSRVIERLAEKFYRISKKGKT